MKTKTRVYNSPSTKLASCPKRVLKQVVPKQIQDIIMIRLFQRVESSRGISISHGTLCSKMKMMLSDLSLDSNSGTLWLSAQCRIASHLPAKCAVNVSRLAIHWLSMPAILISLPHGCSFFSSNQNLVASL